MGGGEGCTVVLSIGKGRYLARSLCNSETRDAGLALAAMHTTPQVLPFFSKYEQAARNPLLL